MLAHVQFGECRRACLPGAGRRAIGLAFDSGIIDALRYFGWAFRPAQAWPPSADWKLLAAVVAGCRAEPNGLTLASSGTVLGAGSAQPDAFIEAVQDPDHTAVGTGDLDRHSLTGCCHRRPRRSSSVAHHQRRAGTST